MSHCFTLTYCHPEVLGRKKIRWLYRAACRKAIGLCHMHPGGAEIPYLPINRGHCHCEWIDSPLPEIRVLLVVRVYEPSGWQCPVIHKTLVLNICHPAMHSALTEHKLCVPKPLQMLFCNSTTPMMGLQLLL